MTLGAIPEQFMDTDDETLVRAVDPLDLMDPEEWADIPTTIEPFVVLDIQAV